MPPIPRRQLVVHTAIGHAPCSDRSCEPSLRRRAVGAGAPADLAAAAAAADGSRRRP